MLENLLRETLSQPGECEKQFEAFKGVLSETTQIPKSSEKCPILKLVACTHATLVYINHASMLTNWKESSVNVTTIEKLQKQLFCLTVLNWIFYPPLEHANGQTFCDRLQIVSSKLENLATPGIWKPESSTTHRLVEIQITSIYKRRRAFNDRHLLKGTSFIAKPKLCWKDTLKERPAWKMIWIDSTWLTSRLSKNWISQTLLKRCDDPNETQNLSLVSEKLELLTTDSFTSTLQNTIGWQSKIPKLLHNVESIDSIDK